MALATPDRRLRRNVIFNTCGKCARVCPFQLQPYLEFSENNQFENPNCIKCSTCVANCPAGILSLETERDAFRLKADTSIEGYEDCQNIQSEVVKINSLAEDVNEYIFAFKSPERVDYKAGQFILIKIQEEPKAYRAYSISSYNEDSKKISVIIKKVEKGYGTGKIFDEIRVGDQVELKGPMGNELVMDPEAEKVLFIANGIGITPFIGMVEDALRNRPNLKELKLLVGQRYENNLLYHDYFKKMAGENDKFEYIPLVSRDKTSELKKGYVNDPISDLKLQDFKVYMCGSKNMILDSYDLLLNNGVKEKDIFYESEEKIM